MGKAPGLGYVRFIDIVRHEEVDRFTCSAQLCDSNRFVDRLTRAVSANAQIQDVDLFASLSERPLDESRYGLRVVYLEGSGRAVSNEEKIDLAIPKGSHSGIQSECVLVEMDLAMKKSVAVADFERARIVPTQFGIGQRKHVRLGVESADGELRGERQAEAQFGD